jgi:hypothetical protein
LHIACSSPFGKKRRPACGGEDKSLRRVFLTRHLMQIMIPAVKYQYFSITG